MNKAAVTNGRTKLRVGMGTRMVSKDTDGMLTLLTRWDYPILPLVGNMIHSKEFSYSKNKKKGVVILETVKALGIPDPSGWEKIIGNLRGCGFQPLVHEVAIRMLNPNLLHLPVGRIVVGTETILTTEGRRLFRITKEEDGQVFLDTVSADDGSKFSPDTIIALARL